MPLAATAALQWYGPAAGAAVIAASSTAAGDIAATARGGAAVGGAGAVTGAAATRLVNRPATVVGSGHITAAAPRGNALLSCTVSIGSRPSADDVAQAVWGARYAPINDPESFGLLLKLAAQILRNRTVTDPVAGTMRVYADDDTTVLLEGGLWQNAAGTVPYSGNGAERRDRLE